MEVQLAHLPADDPFLQNPRPFCFEEQRQADGQRSEDGHLGDDRVRQCGCTCQHLCMRNVVVLRASHEAGDCDIELYIELDLYTGV